MLSPLNAILAGLLQGLLEWLPVSSSGQITLFLAGLFGYSVTEAYGISLFLHFGTLVSAIVFFYRDVLAAIKGLLTLRFNPITRLWIFTTLFSLLVGYPIYVLYNRIAVGLNLDIISVLIGVSLVIIGLLLMRTPGSGNKKLDDMTLRDYLFLGIAQGIAVLPGVSRSGVTILVLLLLGFSSWEAVRTSFLASIPVIFIASLFAGLTEGIVLEYTSLLALFSAFIAGIIGIAIMALLSRRLPLYYFSIAAGVMVLVITVPALFF